MSKKVTTEIFIAKAKSFHGNKYDYSKSEYGGTKTKLCIICPQHGEFWQTPSNHYQFGCTTCGIEARANKNRLCPEEALNKLLLKHNNKYKYPEFIETYKTTKQKIKIICPIHGTFYQKYENHYSGQGCPYCRYTGKDGKTSFYIALVQTETDTFVKVGISKHEDVRERLKHLVSGSKTILFLRRGDPKLCVELEKEIVNQFCFLPNVITRSGGTECFSIEDEEEILKMVETAWKENT